MPACAHSAMALLPFVALVPLIGMPAWLLDGIFIGATAGRALRNAAILATALYIATDLALRPWRRLRRVARASGQLRLPRGRARRLSAAVAPSHFARSPSLGPHARRSGRLHLVEARHFRRDRFGDLVPAVAVAHPSWPATRPPIQACTAVPSSGTIAPSASSRRAASRRRAGLALVLPGLLALEIGSDIDIHNWAASWRRQATPG